MTLNNDNKELLYFNGINDETGEYTLPPMAGDELVDVIQGEAPPQNLNELKHRYQQKETVHLGVKESIDPTKLAQTGWGVIFAHDVDPAVKEALKELIDLRQEQAGNYFHCYEGEKAYRPGESKSESWPAMGPAQPTLKRHPITY